MSSHDAYIRQALATYVSPAAARRDVLNALMLFPDLRPQTRHFDVNGMRKPLLCLEGPLTVHHNGKRCDVPVRVVLRDTHPRQAPAVSVRPDTTSMVVRPGGSMDASGTVSVPYLTQWDQCESELEVLLQVLVIQFEERLPISLTSEAPHSSPRSASIRPYARPITTSLRPESGEVAGSSRSAGRAACEVEMAWESSENIHSTSIFGSSRSSEISRRRSGLSDERIEADRARKEAIERERRSREEMRERTAMERASEKERERTAAERAREEMCTKLLKPRVIPAATSQATKPRMAPATTSTGSSLSKMAGWMFDQMREELTTKSAFSKVESRREEQNTVAANLKSSIAAKSSYADEDVFLSSEQETRQTPPASKTPPILHPSFVTTRNTPARSTPHLPSTPVIPPRPSKRLNTAPSSTSGSTSSFQGVTAGVLCVSCGKALGGGGLTYMACRACCQQQQQQQRQQTQQTQVCMRCYLGRWWGCSQHPDSPGVMRTAGEGATL